LDLQNLNLVHQNLSNYDETFKHNFYTNPVTTSYPDSISLAKYLFADPARCRNTGYMCKINADSTLNLDRLAYYPREQYFQEINNVQDEQNKNIFKIGGHTN
jgi:hypothetical protein